MKNLVLSLITLALAIPAAHATSKPAKGSFAHMQKEALEFVPIFENQTEECDYRVKETREGMTISVKKGRSAVVYLDVASDAQLKLKVEGEESMDGSFAHAWTVKGEGKLELVHLDDAYDHLYVSKDGVTIACELDY